jgi:hypothetical protein
VALVGVAPAGTFPQFDVDVEAWRDDRRDRVDHVHRRRANRCHDDLDGRIAYFLS